MITTLKIENFRLFKNLEIQDLKRVNLFAGKNNSGKTALLEALRIMAAEEDISVIHYILQQRGETLFNFWDKYDSFFYRPELGTIHSNAGGKLRFQINNFHFEKRYLGEKNIQYLLGFRADPILDREVNDLLLHLPTPLLPRDKYVYVPFSANDHFPLGYYWDQVALTPKEDKVVEILRDTILPNLVRLDVQQNDRIMVRLQGEERPIPLKNLGDGAQRILLIAIALVMAKDNVLLIDEIETGLHYSVLEKIWDIIFKYSKELKVQVFATTHSQDALRAFMYLLEKPENNEEGVFYRLQLNAKDGQVEAIRYEPESLELSLESNLDPR
jgi:AAA15 family ATPase/GTPase